MASELTELERQFQANLKSITEPIVKFVPVSLNPQKQSASKEAKSKPEQTQEPREPQEPKQAEQRTASYVDHLKEVSSFHVFQDVDVLKVAVGWESPTFYTIKDQTGRELFRANELTDCLGRQFCCNDRPFNIQFKDLNNRHFLTLDKRASCSWFCGYFCRDTVLVTTPMGELVGSIEEDFHIIYPRFNLRNSEGQIVVRVLGSCCGCNTCWRDVVFELSTRDGVKIGEITKNWSGFGRELLTEAHQFHLNFTQVDTSAPMKAVCLGALFLIDFMYYQYC